MHKIRLVTTNRILLTVLLLTTIAFAQERIQNLNECLRDATRNVFGFTFEERTRWEQKDGVNFGKSVNQQDMLSRLRIGAEFAPVSWFSTSAMGQDARAPFYGAHAPSTIRDTMGLRRLI